MAERTLLPPLLGLQHAVLYLHKAYKWKCSELLYVHFSRPYGDVMLSPFLSSSNS